MTGTRSTDRTGSPKSSTTGNRIARLFTWIMPGRKRPSEAPHSFRVLGGGPASSYMTLRSRKVAKTTLPPVVTPAAATPAAPVTPATTTPASGILGGIFTSQLDLDRMRVLEESTHDGVPRYLFRACSPTSGGGLKGLNTVDGIFPHAFVDANGKRLKDGGNKSIHELGHATTRKMAMGHLSGQRPARTDNTYSQFSSWAASLALVLQYAHGRAHSGGLVCVLDRYNLPKNTKVYHCSAMMKAGLCDSPYDHEYLVHGPVEGPGFKAVPVLRLIELGVYIHVPVVMPQSTRYWWGPIQAREWESLFNPKEFTETEVRALRPAAEEFGRDFTVPVLAALLTLSRRRIGADGKFDKNDVKIFADVVADLYVPEEYGTDNSLIQPAGIYTAGYPMVSQLAALFKGLVEYSYGKGARTRRKLKVEDLTAELGALGLPTEHEVGAAAKSGGMSTHIAIGVSDVVY